MDKHRMLTILLSRMLERLLRKSYESVNANNIYSQALSQFCEIAHEFLLRPLIDIGFTERVYGPKNAVERAISTPALDFLHCMI